MTVQSVRQRDGGAPDQVAYRKLWWVGGLVLLAAVVAVLAIQTLAVALFGISPAFLPLTLGPAVFFTVIGVFGATVVYAILGRVSQQPLRLFRRIALVVLVLSLIPDVLMLSPEAPFSGVTVSAVGTLMLQHVVVWLICVEGLTRFAVRSKEE